jgi:hypothetical protein
LVIRLLFVELDTLRRQETSTSVRTFFSLGRPAHIEDGHFQAKQGSSKIT